MDEDKVIEEKNEQAVTLSEAIRKVPDLDDYDLWETIGELRIE